MTDLQSLIRLQSWLSPAFPTGAFSYSHGLEAAIADEWIVDRETLAEWLEALLDCGPGWNDAVLLAQSWRVCDKSEELAEVVELAEALSFSAERHQETTSQGSAFVNAAKAWIDIPSLPDVCPLPVAVGAVSGGLNTGLEQTLTAYLHAYVSNQIQAALRLMKLGQQRGVELLAELESAIIQSANRAFNSTLHDLGSNTFMADIAAMQHETLSSRIFRS